VGTDGTFTHTVGGHRAGNGAGPEKGFGMGRLTRPGVWGALAALGVLGGIFAGGLADGVLGTDQPVPAAAAPTRPAIVALPAPAVRPVPVAADGECGAAMQAIRVLQRTAPSGSMLPEAADEQLNADLEHLDRACTSTPDAEQAFRDRELTPWLTYLPPTDRT
jgi:hypothetical protein